MIVFQLLQLAECIVQLCGTHGRRCCTGVVAANKLAPGLALGLQDAGECPSGDGHNTLPRQPPLLFLLQAI